MAFTVELYIPMLRQAAALDGLPELPSLGKMLSRAHREEQVFEGSRARSAWLFGMGDGTAWDLPVAALTHLADTGGWDSAYWLRADPVHLRPDMAQLHLFPSATLGLIAREAQQLTDTLNAHFETDGLRFEAPRPDRWYLRLGKGVDAQCTDLPDALNAPMEDCMPDGSDALQLKRWMNEAQMLFHDHAVNLERAREGRWAANGIWLWGGGSFGELHPEPPSGVWSDEPLCAGLASLGGSEPLPLPGGFAEWLAAAGEGRQLVVLDQLLEPMLCGDREAVQSALQQLEDDWFAPAHTALHDKLLDSLTLLGDRGPVFTLTRGDLRRFWKRPQAWTELW